MKKYNTIAFFVFLSGLIIRFKDIARPFWIDEVVYMNLIKYGTRQEFLTVWIGRVLCYFGLDSETWIRLPFVLAGSITVCAVYYIIQNKKVALITAIFVAFCPLFTYWSGFARPYAFAGLFVVLGFRWPWLNFFSVAATPYSIVGFNWFKLKKWWPVYLILVFVAYILFIIRPDTDRNFLNLEFLIHAKRLWYLPVLSLVMHCADLLSRKSQRICRNNK